MDRRMLLVFALAITVLLLNSLIFGQKKRSVPPSPGVVDSTEVIPDPTSGSPTPEPPGTAAIPQGTMLIDADTTLQNTGLVHVETEMVEAVFDPMGGGLRSWKLKQYTDADEDPADLVRNPEIGAIWLALRSGGQVVRTDSTLFRSTVNRGSSGTEILFRAEGRSGAVLEKRFFVPSQGYDCQLDVRVEGFGANSNDASWEIGWIDGLPLLERNPKYDQMSIAAVALFGKDYQKVGGRGRIGCAAGGGGKKSETREGTLRWVGVRNKYFLGALLLDEPRDRKIILASDGTEHTASALMREPLEFSGYTERSYRIYLGPIHYGSLASYNVGLERVQDLGPGVLRPFSKLLMKFFEALNHVIPNYGFLILILSVLVRLAFYPLTKKSMESMKRMQQLKPEMERINEKYKEDPERKNREVMELYKKKKVNPLGGCLPMLVQLPVLSGLYYVLSNAVQLRKEPFVLWITDLSAPDTVAHVAGFPVNPMPLIMAATMIWQQRMTPTDPRQRSIGYMMPIFMTFLFYSMSSGLVFYWTISNLMTVLQQTWMNRSPKESVEPEEDAPPEPPRGRKKRARRN